MTDLLHRWRHVAAALAPTPNRQRRMSIIDID
jgi:hypothetical protein